MVITFGATARSKNAVGFTNASSTSAVMVGLLREAIAPSATKYVYFSYLDDSLSSQNRRSDSLYSVNSLGNQYKGNDVEELCTLIANGKITLSTATLTPVSSGFTVTSTAPLTAAAAGDGSYIFS